MHIETRGGVLALSGPLTVSTLDAAAEARLCAAVTDQAVDMIDLAEVTRADSACVALLLAACRAKHAAGQRLRLQRLPEDVLMLAELYEVGAWIGEQTA